MPLKSAAKVIIVTGANRGIGLAICKQILSRSPSTGPLKLLATSRQGHKLELSIGDGDREVIYPKLDISNAQSISAFEDEVKARHGGVAALINNAGINLDAKYGADSVRETLDVNFRATVKMCQTFLPHMSNNGRIVNLSSVSSTLKFYSPAIQRRLNNPDATLDDLEQLAQEYEKSVRNRTESHSGFGTPIRSYAFSKALLRAATSILSRDHHHNHPNSKILINSCCPGWIKTDMGALVGRGNAPKTAEEGATIPVHLALDDIGGVTGEYFANDSIRSKGLGKVQEWT